jgi:predicted Zn finger-like uncharacterized protein
MRIACPSCAAEYEVPAHRLPPRKMVRCAGCGGEWMAVRDAEEVIPPPEPAAPPPESLTEMPAPVPAVTAMDRLVASSPPAPSRAGLVGAWVLTFAVLAGATASLVAWREEVVAAWPPIGRILGPIDHMKP